jgi:hypothetical protein
MTAPTPAQAAHRAYWVTLLRGEEPTDAYDDEESEYQRAWDASAQAVAGPLEAEIKRLRADLADAEAEIGRWPRCPAGCRCRVGTDDADALECGCDGPCTAATETITERNDQ